MSESSSNGKSRRELLIKALGVGAGAMVLGCNNSTQGNPMGGGDDGPLEKLNGVELVAQAASPIVAGDGGLWAQNESAALSSGAAPPAWPRWTALGGASGTGCATPGPQHTPVGLEQLVDARRFGARGDGCTDDRPALQAAIDSLAKSGGTVFVPAGVYLINQKNSAAAPPLLLRSNVRLLGAGRGATVIKLGDTANEAVGGRPNQTIIANYGHLSFGASTTADKNLAIESLTLDGNAANNSLPSGFVTAAGVALDNASQVSVHDVEILSAHHGLQLGTMAGSTDGQYDSLWIHDCTGIGILVVRAQRNRFCNCLCVGNRLGGGGIVSLNPGDDCIDNQFVNCAFKDSSMPGAIGFDVSTSTATVDSVGIINCEFRGNLVAVEVQAFGTTATNLRFLDCQFAGNLNTPMSITGPATGQIIGCAFIDNETSGSQNGILVLDAGSLNWMIVGNRFKPLTNNSGMGINVRGNSGGHIIVGNVFLTVNGFDEFLVSTNGASVNNSLFHSNIGGAVYEDGDNLGAKKLNLSELHTVITRAATSFAAADLGPGQVGYRQDTGELFFNLPGGVRKISTAAG
jgi:hypothetical protein